MQGDPARAEQLFREALTVYEAATRDDAGVVLSWRTEAAKNLAERILPLTA